MSISITELPAAAALNTLYTFTVTVTLHRDDGTDSTLLRSYPTRDRGSHVFVTPRVAIASSDPLQLLETLPGSKFIVELFLCFRANTFFFSGGNFVFSR
jgi:hypothetical protein